MTIMKTSLTLFLFTLFTAFSAGSEIYKTTDEHGNVVFTDKPPSSGPREEVKLREPTKVPSLAPSQIFTRSVGQPDQTEVKIKYDRFEISSPENDSTVRNSGNFQIKLSVFPNLARDHEVRFWINGKAVSKSQRSLVHSVTDMERGTHQLKAELLDQNGKVLKSATSTVHVQRTIYRPPASN